MANCAYCGQMTHMGQVHLCVNNLQSGVNDMENQRDRFREALLKLAFFLDPKWQENGKSIDGDWILEEYKRLLKFISAGAAHEVKLVEKIANLENAFASEKVLLNKQYSGESIVDVEQDVYNACADVSIPSDEYCFKQGTFTVRVSWNP